MSFVVNCYNYCYLGFHSEHNRPDRDDYVDVHLENVCCGMEKAFRKCEECSTQNLPYDYNSIMHFGEYAWSTDGPTITRKGCSYAQSIYEGMKIHQDEGCRLGNRHGLTELDIEKVNKLYCPNAA